MIAFHFLTGVQNKSVFISYHWLDLAVPCLDSGFLVRCNKWIVNEPWSKPEEQLMGGPQRGADVGSGSRMALCMQKPLISSVPPSAAPQGVKTFIISSAECNQMPASNQTNIYSVIEYQFFYLFKVKGGYCQRWHNMKKVLNLTIISNSLIMKVK